MLDLLSMEKGMSIQQYLGILILYLREMAGYILHIVPRYMRTKYMEEELRMTRDL